MPFASFVCLISQVRAMAQAVTYRHRTADAGVQT